MVPTPAAATTATTKFAERYQPSTASIVVDANSGAVLQASNADSPRHPASLTKIMTLYLLFERLEAGKIKLTSEMKVSRACRRAGAVQAGAQARRNDRGGDRDPRHRHQIGKRRGGHCRRSDRRRRNRIRADDDRQSSRAWHDAHHLSQRLRPARRPADHHRARHGHSRPRDPRPFPRILSLFLHPHLRVPRQSDAQPQSSAGARRRRRRHQDRLHSRFRFQHRHLGAPPPSSHRGGGVRRAQRRCARRAHARPDR